MIEDIKAALEVLHKGGVILYPTDTIWGIGCDACNEDAVKKVYAIKKIALPQLTDYTVHIPPGGKSDALCETIITWMQDGKEFKTRGLDSDQTVSAIKATQKMLNSIV